MVVFGRSHGVGFRHSAAADRPVAAAVVAFLAAIVTFVAAISQAAESPSAAGLIAHYPLDVDGRDTSGRHHAETHADTPAADGRIGAALRFDGRSSHLRLPPQATAGLRRFTLAVWVRTRQAQAAPREQFWKNPTILGVATDGPGSRDFGLILENGAAAYHHGLASSQDGRAVDTCFFSDAALNDGHWHHLAVSNDGSAMRLFVDGRAVAGDVLQHGGALGDEERADHTPSAHALIDRPLFVGGCNDTTQPKPPSYAFEGCLDDLRLWNRALSAAEIAAIWTQTTGQPVPAAPAPRRSVASTPAAPVEAVQSLVGSGGLRWRLERRGGKWTLGTLLLRDRPVDAPLDAGVLALRSTDGRSVEWLPADECRVTSPRSARLSGQTRRDGATLRYSVDVALRDDAPAASLSARWSVDKDLAGYEVCLAYHGLGGEAASGWRCTLYPFAGNAARVRRDRLTFVGVPAALLFREDLSLVALFGIDPAMDYLNPTTWTGATGFHFDARRTPPQFRVGGGKLKAGVDYAVPLQVFLCDAGDSAAAVTCLVGDWRRVNSYRIEPLRVRSPQAAFDLFLQGRKQSRMWHPGFGYQIMDIWRVVYVAESPINAYFDYLLYEQTGDPLWRRRAMETMALVLAAQHTDPADPHFGVMETNFELDENPEFGRRPAPPWSAADAAAMRRAGRLNSRDHSPNFGYKLDMNGYAARYMLLLWKRVLDREGLDRRDWRLSAVRIADWIVRQQNPDGGLPQVVDYRPGAKPSISVVSGRTLVGMPIIARLTGDPKYARLADDLERFLRTRVEGRYWFTGAHVDLWPKDFEADSVWHAVEYWLDRFEQTGRPDCLRRAEGDAWFAFLMGCPKQLSWVRNPTQTCHTEQENYLQYSNYCYNNRKYDCLDRLARHTGQRMFAEWCERMIQCGFWGQATAGDWLGGQHERMSDPWKGVSDDVNSTGAVYVSELALEANLQLLETGRARARPER